MLFGVVQNLLWSLQVKDSRFYRGEGANKQMSYEKRFRWEFVSYETSSRAIENNLTACSGISRAYFNSFQQENSSRKHSANF